MKICFLISYKDRLTYISGSYTTEKAYSCKVGYCKSGYNEIYLLMEMK